MPFVDYSNFQIIKTDILNKASLFLIFFSSAASSTINEKILDWNRTSRLFYVPYEFPVFRK